MRLAWVRSNGGPWHWYNVKGCGAAWAMQDWSGSIEETTTDSGTAPEGSVCHTCMQAAIAAVKREATMTEEQQQQREGEAGNEQAGDVETVYSVKVFWSIGDGCYIAVPDKWPWLSAFGDTPEDALAEIAIVVRLAKEVLAEELPNE